MRVMIDTNVIISAILKRGSVPDLVLEYACENCDIVLCDHIISESYDVAKKRFPHRLSVLDNLFATLRYELVPAPRIGGVGVNIRDIKDQPILNAAIAYDVDILITGDGHFLELNINLPEIMKPSAFLQQFM